jgi:hypothetical protein
MKPCVRNVRAVKVLLLPLADLKVVLPEPHLPK